MKPGDDEPSGSTERVRPDTADPLRWVVHAKLRPAAIPDHLIRRPRLYSLLDELADSPLTAVVAPAGSGKTSLLRGWVSESEIPHAWLSLDEADRDPAQMWLGVMAALDSIAPGCADRAARLVIQPGGVLRAVGTLLDDLEARDAGPRMLVVDDLQLVDDDALVRQSLALFLQYLPGWLRVVIASRHSPPLPVQRLRGRGQLGEVQFDELRFSTDEAASMLARLAPSLPAEQLGEIASRAQGWAASIQLAGLAARSSDAHARAELGTRAGERLYLEEYVWREVLNNESDDVVDVMLATAVVQRIDPGLAEVLSGRPDASDLLARAEERGLFVTRIEPTGSYEIHAVVREVLVDVLAGRTPHRLGELHAAAAQWYEHEDQIASALDHWLRAGRPKEALRLLAARVTALYDSGGESSIRRTIAAIPAATVGSDFASTLDYAWCQLLVDRQQFIETVEYLASWSRQRDVDRGLAARVGVLQSTVAVLRGDWSDGARIARAGLARMGDDWSADPIGQFIWNLVARNTALSESWDDDAPKAREIVRSLVVLPERRLALEGTRALGEALAGHPAKSLRRVRDIRKVPAVSSMTILRSELDAAEAVALRETGDLPAALPLLLELSESVSEPTPYCRLLADLELVYAWLDTGNVEGAEQAFQAAAALVDAELTGKGSRAWLARAGTTLGLALGKSDDSRRWAAEVKDPFWSKVCAARVAMADGSWPEAEASLRDAAPRCARHEAVRAVLLSRVVPAVDEAEMHLISAVELAVARGLVQTIASEGAPVVEAIERLAWRIPQEWTDRLRRATTPGLARHDVDSLALVDDLTPRELEVLRMLPSRLTLREIANELFISQNTLKFHLKLVYRKLDCGSRAEAATIARGLTRLRRPAHPRGAGPTAGA